MSVSPRARASAILPTAARAVCCAPEPPRSAKFNSRRDNPSLSRESLRLFIDLDDRIHVLRDGNSE